MKLLFTIYDNDTSFAERCQKFCSPNRQDWYFKGKDFLHFT